MLADADSIAPVGGAIWGGLFNSGQICISVERIYVSAGLRGVLVAPGRGGEQDAPGPRRAGQLRHRNRRDGQRERRWPSSSATSTTPLTRVPGCSPAASAAGARPASTRRPCWWTSTTHGVHARGNIRSTLPIMRVSDEDEAVELANDSQLRSGRQRLDGDQGACANASALS